MGLQDRDDIDALYERLELVDPPSGLAGRVLSRTVGRDQRANAWRWGVVIWSALSLMATGTLALLSVSLGWELHQSGSLYLLRATMGDFDLLMSIRSEFLQAVLETVPWFNLAALLLNVTILFLLSRQLLERLPGQRWAGGSGAERCR